MIEFSAEQIAGLLGGKVVGDPNVKVNNIARIEEGSPGMLSFLANPKYEDHLYTCESSVVLVNNDFTPTKEVKPTMIKVPDAYMAFAAILNEYQKLRANKVGTHTSAFIEESSTIGENIYLGANVYIGDGCSIGDNVKIYPNTYISDNVKIGDNVTIFAGVKIYHDSVIGNHCTLHSGVVIGSDGFGFAPNSENNYQKVPQIGNVTIEDHVEVGSNTTIDRATIGSTIIRKGVKLDNLIQIAHNVEIGENTVIAAQTGVAGSSKIGKNCMIGGQVGIVGHIKIADEVKIAAQSGVGSSINEKGKIIQGSPAFDIGDYKRSYVYFRKLPNLINELKS